MGYWKQVSIILDDCEFKDLCRIRDALKMLEPYELFPLVNKHLLKNVEQRIETYGLEALK